MSERRQTVAVAQIAPELGQIDGNADKHVHFIERARDSGAELIAFPELSLTGYQVGASGPKLALRADSPCLLRLAEAAGPSRVVVGFIEEGYAAQLFNSAAVLHAGKVEFVHRKLNLANYGGLEEGKHFAAGRYIETFPTGEDFVAAIMVCADMWNPALVQLATLHGATCLVVPTNSANDAVSSEFSNPDGWAMLLQTYAILFGLPTMFANRVGTEGELEFWGGSRILGPKGQVLAELGAEEDIALAELNFDDVTEARYQLPTVRDSNLSLIRREMDRLDTRVGVPQRYRPR